MAYSIPIFNMAFHIIYIYIYIKQFILCVEYVILHHTYFTLTSKYQIPTFWENQPSSLGCYFWEILKFADFRVCFPTWFSKTTDTTRGNLILKIVGPILFCAYFYLKLAFESGLLSLRETVRFCELAIFQCFRPNPYTSMCVLTKGSFSLLRNKMKNHVNTLVVS